jgi:hypothetical protein
MSITTHDESIQFNNDLQMKTSFEQAENSLSSQISLTQSTPDDASSLLSIEDEPDIFYDASSPDIITIVNDQPFEFPCIDSHRERTLSDTSSATVDYDFDTEMCTTLTLESQQSSFSLDI